MKIVHEGDTIVLKSMPELGASTCASLRQEFSRCLGKGVKRIDIDLSDTEFLDCAGAGALLTLRRQAAQSGSSVSVRLLNPARPLCRLFAVTGVDRVFPIQYSARPACVAAPVAQDNPTPCIPEASVGPLLAAAADVSEAVAPLGALSPTTAGPDCVP